jgi:hypothetical protein
VELRPIRICEHADELTDALPQSDQQSATHTYRRGLYAPMLPRSTIAVVIRAKEPKKPRKADLKEGT